MPIHLHGYSIIVTRPQIGMRSLIFATWGTQSLYLEQS